MERVRGGKPSGVAVTIGMANSRAQRRRSVLIHLPLSVGECQRVVVEEWEGRVDGRTFDRKRWAVVAGFHKPAEEDRHVGDVDILEELRVLDV